MSSNFLVDSHCHINFPELAADIDGVIARMHSSGVLRLRRHRFEFCHEQRNLHPSRIRVIARRESWAAREVEDLHEVTWVAVAVAALTDAAYA